MLGRDQEWVLSSWAHDNWENDKKQTSSTLLVTLPTDNFDPTQAVQAIHKHNQSITDKKLKCAAQRNREDTAFVWIYDKNNEKTTKDITEQLRPLINTVRVYSDVQSFVRQIKHAAHISAILVYDSPFLLHSTNR